MTVLLAACSSGDTAADLAATEPVTMQPIEPQPSGPLTAAQISTALSERNFSYAAQGRKGTITYYGDGTFSYEEAGKGPGTGLWQASDGKLCEARNPTSFLPKGTPSVCSPFTSDGTIYTAGTMQLTPA